MQGTFLFIEEAEEKAAREGHQKRLEDHIASWGYCWNWAGPEANGYCEANSCVVDLMPGQEEFFRNNLNFNQEWKPERVYCYMEQCRLIRRLDDEHWEAVIEMEHNGKPWYKNGIRLKMHITDIWPPTRKLREQRDKEKAYV